MRCCYRPIIVFHHHQVVNGGPLQMIKRRYRSQTTSFNPLRPLPDYSPRKLTVKDSILVEDVCRTIALRRLEPFNIILNHFEPRFDSHHLIWVLIRIRNDNKLALKFFRWAGTHKKRSIEAYCILINIMVASGMLRIASDFLKDVALNPHKGFASNPHQLYDMLIYTYKVCGSNPLVFDLLIKVFAQIGMVHEAMDVFSKNFELWV